MISCRVDPEYWSFLCYPITRLDLHKLRLDNVAPTAPLCRIGGGKGQPRRDVSRSAAALRLESKTLSFRVGKVLVRARLALRGPCNEVRANAEDEIYYD